jgi:hypothetical protein
MERCVRLSDKDSGNRPGRGGSAEPRGATIRLSCAYCENDHDGITPAGLAALKRAGWADIQRMQTYNQSIKTYDDPAKAPPGYSVFDWFTHLGICPECVAKGGV